MSHWDRRDDLDLSSFDAEAMAFAETVCTAKQMEALRLRAQGLGFRPIGRMLNITQTSARNRVDNAVLHLRKAILERELQEQEERDGKHADIA